MAGNEAPAVDHSLDKSGDHHTIESVDSSHAKEQQSGPIVSALAPAVRQLNTAERVDICRAVGYLMEEEEKASLSQQKTVNVNTLPDGLYKNIILSRRGSQRKYQVVAFVYNACLVLQLVLGAILVSLGASDKTKSTKSVPITVLAAANTINAGLIALLHNSGLPGRLRNDWGEYGAVEMFVAQLIHTGVVPNDFSIADIKQDAWTRYEQAVATVEGNKPASYIGTVPTEKPSKGA